MKTLTKEIAIKLLREGKVLNIVEIENGFELSLATKKKKKTKKKSYYTVKEVQDLGYLLHDSAMRLWRPLKETSEDNNYTIKRVKCSEYGEVNAYHKEIWSDVYDIEL
jgi:hypothetical protein